VQQKLMRHARISTTMNVYGMPLMDAKQEANSKVVRRALRSAQPMRIPQTHQINPTAFSRALLFGVIWGWPIA
jgi:hypothetical protein